MSDLLDDYIEFRGGSLLLSSENVRGERSGSRREKLLGTGNRSPQVNPSVLSGTDSLTSSSSSFAADAVVDATTEQETEPVQTDYPRYDVPFNRENIEGVEENAIQEGIIALASHENGEYLGSSLSTDNKTSLSITGKLTPNVSEVAAAGKVQILNNDHHDLSANAFATRDMPSNPALPSTNTFGGGIDYNFDNKTSISLTSKHTPNVSKVAGAGKVQILNNDHHDLSANAFATRDMPSNPALPSTNTFGGGIDYNFDNKTSISLTSKHTPNVSKVAGAGKVQILNNDHHDLSANAFATRDMPSNPALPSTNTFSGGLDYNFDNKTSLSVTGKHTAYGNEVVTSGKVQILNNEHHDLSANAFATRDMPSNPALPSTNTFSGGLDYNFDNKTSLSVTGKHTAYGNEVVTSGKVQILNNEHHDFSANAFATRDMPSNPGLPSTNTFGGGLDYNFNNKTSLSLISRHTPNVSEVIGAGKVQILNNGHHDLSANAFATRDMPSNPALPSTNTFRGGLDYNFHNKTSLSLTGKHTSDGSEVATAGKMQILNSGHHDLSANAYATRDMPSNQALPITNTFGGELDYNFDNKTSLSLTSKHTPNVSEVAGAGKVQIINNGHHDLSANAFATRDMPSNPALPSTNTFCGGIDYNFDNKTSLSLTGKYTPDVIEVVAAGKVELLHNNHHNVTAKAFASRSMPCNPALPISNTVDGALDYTSDYGHKINLTGKHIPNVGNKVTAAGKVQIISNDNHDLSANAFATRDMPSNPALTSFNNFGGELDYTYRDKMGASLDVLHTPLHHQTDFSAKSYLNLFRGPTTSLDINAGVFKSFSQFITTSSWKPFGGLSFTIYL